MMKARGLAALFVTGEENFTYFTGARSLIPWRSFARPGFALLPLERDPVVVVHTAMLEQTQKESLLKDIRPYETSKQVPLGGSPVEMLAEIFEEFGLDRASIGAELGLDQRLGFPYEDFQRLKSASPNSRFVDASDPLWDLRMVKSAAEIIHIRKACQITGKARQKCFQTIEAGMTEKQVARLFFKYMMELGADSPCFGFVISGTLAESTWVPTDKKLRKGETVWIDGGCYVGDYTCDFDRIATVGKPSRKQLELHGFICKTNKRMIDKFKPGVAVADIAKICRKEYEKAGLPINRGGRMGHGQGMLPTEPPSISELDSTVLKPGMVVSTEPGLLTDWGVFVWEDLIAITEDGHELLTKETTELVKI